MAESEIKKIDFIGIGAAKCGSSWLSQILSQHPDIEIPKRKELNYFNTKEISGGNNKNNSKVLDYYLNFWTSNSSKTKGEFSPQYFSDLEAPKNILAAFPNIKLIVIIRNPVHRAMSHLEYDQHFNQLISKDTSPKNAFDKYPYLLKEGKYVEHLERWLNFFPKENIQLIVLEEAILNPERISQELFQFLGLSSPDKINFNKVNENKSIKFKWISYLLKFPGKVDKKLSSISIWRKFSSSKLYNTLFDLKIKLTTLNSIKRKKNIVSSETNMFLKNYYAESNQKLKNLFGNDLSVWD